MADPSNSNHSTFSQIRQDANLESSRNKMEYFASKRSEIKSILQLIEKEEKDDIASIDDCRSNTKKSSGYFVMPCWINDNNNIERSNLSSKTSSSSSSMFFMEKDDTKHLLHQKLQKVETELIQVCNDVKNNMDRL